MKCLTHNLEVNYPCSPVCPLFGDCVVAFQNEQKKRVRTNAARIRAMSDEELAKFLCNFRSCDSSEHPCNGCQAEPYCMIGHNGMIDWLQQPAEEDT